MTATHPSAPPPGAPPRRAPGRVTVTSLPAATVRVRPIRPSDGPVLQAGMGELSEQTRWLRFHMPISRLSDAQLRLLVDVDHHDREALLAEVRGEGGGWEPVGVARYARVAADRADLAVVVTDAWQGRGVGSLLIERLSAVAREEGIVAFVAQVLSENRRVLALLRRRGPRRVQLTMAGAVTDAVWWLTD